MIIKRFLPRIAVALIAFVLAIFATSLWRSHVSRSRYIRSQVNAVIPQNEQPWPLKKEIVSRSLQSHSFRTNKLKRNSNDEIVWRWLKEAIAAYPQNWVKLNISDSESYGVVLEPPKVLDSTELKFYNRELKEKGLPTLTKDKRYLPINVYHGAVVCPSWSGFIDVEEAKLVYFEGTSA